MISRILKWFWVLMVAFLLIEQFRVRYYYRIWNHPDSAILAVALAELLADNNMNIMDAVGLDSEWLSSHFLFSVRDLKNRVRMTNVYWGPSNETTTKVESASAHRFWNTDAWEVAVCDQFKNSVKWSLNTRRFYPFCVTNRPSKNPNDFIPQLTRSHWLCFRWIDQFVPASSSRHGFSTNQQATSLDARSCYRFK